MAPRKVVEPEEKRILEFLSIARKAISRKELANEMGVDYSNRAAKQAMRNVLRTFVSSKIKIDRPFHEYDYVSVMYGVIKATQKYMNRNFVTDPRKNWRRYTAHHAVKALIDDDIRNIKNRPSLLKKRAEARGEGDKSVAAVAAEPSELQPSSESEDDSESSESDDQTDVRISFVLLYPANLSRMMSSIPFSLPMIRLPYAYILPCCSTLLTR